MSDAQMIGMLGELGIEDCGRFERSRIGLVAQRLACDERPHRRWTRSADGLASTGLAAGRAWPPIVEYCLATREPRIAASQTEQSVGVPRSVR